MPSKKKATACRRGTKKSEASSSNLHFETESLRNAKAGTHGKIMYNVKWVGYDEKSNTEEQDLNILGRMMFLEYVKKTLLDDYAKSVDISMENMHRMSHIDFVEKLNPLSILAENWLLGGNVLFMHNDSIGSKRMFLNALKNYNQTCSLYTIFLTHKKQTKAHFDKWRGEHNLRAAHIADYPTFRVHYAPRVDWSIITPPPPPLYSIVYKAFTEEQMGSAVAPESEETGFVTFCKKKDDEDDKDGENDEEDKACSDSEDHYCRKTKLPLFLDYKYMKRPSSHDSELHDIGKTKVFQTGQTRFGTNLLLYFEPEDVQWIVVTSADVEPNKALLKMCGVIRDKEEAHSSFVEEGERIAFSSFVAIQGTDKVLDRRQYYDLSKFIGHSCNPTCEVRLIDNGTNVPDVVVFSKVKLIAEKHRLTLDYFKCFTRDVVARLEAMGTKKSESGIDAILNNLYRKFVDFVFCNCSSTICREILYIDKFEGESETMLKSQKLRNLPEAFKFHGMQLAEDEAKLSVVLGNDLVESDESDDEVDSQDTVSQDSQETDDSQNTTDLEENEEEEEAPQEKEDSYDEEDKENCRKRKIYDE